MLIYAVARVVHASLYRSPVAFSYDEHSKAAALQNGRHDFKERHPLAAECMATLTPLDDKRVPALQAADLITHTAKRYFENRIDNQIPMKRAGSELDLGELKEWARSLCRVWFWNKERLREIVQSSIEAHKGGSRGLETDVFW